MEQKKVRRISRRREAAGRWLNIVCTALIILFLIIGKAQGLPIFRSDGSKAVKQTQKNADSETAEAESGESGDTGEEGEDAQEETPTGEVIYTLPDRPTPGKYDFTLSFMGDVNFDDDWATMTHLSELSGDLSKAIDPDMLTLMQAADLFSVNNEFAFTSRGTALEGKAYTFRAKPGNVSLYETMGVDMVTLANNHIYDFGPEGLTDTLSTLESASIDHVGAGENLSDASRPCYVDIQNVRVAFVNACNAEVNRYTPEATATSSGVLLCYEHDKFLAATREAKENADYVIAIVHWGRDYVYETSDEQRQLARELIDAGASVVIGGHSHSLQGIEYYNHCPIFYSLGSCWFNGKTLETYLLELHIASNGKEASLTPVLVPAIQRDAELHLAADVSEAKEVTDLILKYSAGIQFESYPDETHLGHTIAVLRESEDAVDDWGGVSAAAVAATEESAGAATEESAEGVTEAVTEAVSEELTNGA